MSKKKIKWGIISCAGIAEGSTIPGLLEADNAQLYAISGRTEAKLTKFKEKFNPVKVYDTYEALLDDPEVEAIYLPLPNGLHCEWAIKAAEKKKHVLCEKPLAVNVEEVKKMQKAADDNGVLLMEAFASRHNPVLHTVKKMIEDGDIGQLKYIETHFTFVLGDQGNVRLNKAIGGGATFDIGAYTIGTIRELVGREPISVQAVGDIDPASGVDMTSCVLMDFGQGVMATSYCSFSTYGWSGYTVTGDKGRIVVPVDYNDKGELSIKVYRDDKEESRIITAPNNYRLEIEQFGRCILEGEQPLVTYEDSIGNVAVTDQVLAQIFEHNK